jgi:hypothetical protein
MPNYNKVDNALGAYHIATDYANYEAARSAFFVLTVPESQLGNLRKPTETDDKAPSDNSVIKLNSAKAAEILRLNVVKTSVPQFTVGTEKYQRGNDVINFATVPEWKDGTLVVDDIVGVNTKDILISWLYLAYNPHNRMGGRMKDYKKTAVLQEYTQDYELVREWNIEGIFVTGVEDSDFDRENDGKRQLTVQFKYDRALLTEVSYGANFK